MLDVIKNLLALQERDRRLLRMREEFSRVAPERQTQQNKAAEAAARLEQLRLQARQAESDRKRLELDADAQKELISKYSAQQFQTRKNEEYRALTHEIEICQKNISQLDDRQLELMERIDQLNREIAAATQQEKLVRQDVDTALARLTERETILQSQIAAIEQERAGLRERVDGAWASRYERLLKQKGSNVVVGINHGVCGGCHIQLQRQVIVQCQAVADVVSCPNCGRILYFTAEMDTVPSE